MTTNAPTYTCWTVRDNGEGKKGFWVEIGAGWVNRDESLSLKLDALPMNGQIVVRKREPKVETGQR